MCFSEQQIIGAYAFVYVLRLIELKFHMQAGKLISYMSLKNKNRNFLLGAKWHKNDAMYYDIKLSYIQNTTCPADFSLTNFNSSVMFCNFLW